ncbi:MAG: sugar ABC transporter permease [Hydrogenibacillus schlegelii]|uniref:Sugar ABC transporter permease n=1 Tax=Hydrogenibacillus schlegelii TaxID=1484 RepID=A0A947GHM4_HYDSH|nr:sugar ABC transporter permease [Hydrogenibacillus schlegelii]
MADLSRPLFRRAALPAASAGAAFRRRLLPYALIAPALFFVAVFSTYPVLKTLLLAGTAEGGIGRAFGELWRDPVFRLSLGATLRFLAYSSLPAMAIAFFLALWIHGRPRRFRRALEGVWVLPLALPVVSAAAIWLFVFTPQYGLLAVLADRLGLTDPALLRKPETALWALAVVEIWREMGFNLLVFLAGLSTIPRDVEEAARLDGAGEGRLTLMIRLPLLWPTFIFVGTVSLLHALSTIDPIFVMTQGGPNNATNLLLYQMYLTAFFYGDWPRAAATAAVFLGLAGLIAGVQVYGLERLFRRDDGVA